MSKIVEGMVEGGEIDRGDGECGNDLLVRPQPQPVQSANSVEVLPRLIGRLRAKYEGKVWPGEARLNRLIKGLYKRNQLGIKTYKVPLSTNNGREPLTDWDEELYDGLMYGEQALGEAVEQDIYFPKHLLDKTEELIFELMDYMDSRGS